MNLLELFAKFLNEQSAREWLENIRWPDGDRHYTLLCWQEYLPRQERKS